MEIRDRLKQNTQYQNAFICGLNKLFSTRECTGTLLKFKVVLLLLMGGCLVAPKSMTLVFHRPESNHTGRFASTSVCARPTTLILTVMK